MSDDHGDDRLGPQRSNLHVAIIMDGSGRWATARGLPRSEGHRAGRAAVRRVIEAAPQCGIATLTLFAFSSDNWRRPESEVFELMRIFEGFFSVDAPALIRRGVRVSMVGRRDRLPVSLLEAIGKVEASSRPGDRLHVRLAIDYSGREAILRAAHEFPQDGDASTDAFARRLAEVEQAGQAAPDIDLLIRTGGEQRLSNCPLWEIAYAELYFTPCLWPDFGAADLDAAVQEFRRRDRRFGRVPEVVHS
jgi:undecaprenyl diphosphate synthase